MLHILLFTVALFIPVRDDVVLVRNFLDNRTEKGFTLDRSYRRDIVSVSATGLGCYAYARAVDLNMLDRVTALQYINTAFDETVLTNVGNHGWLYHFTDLSGKPVEGTEISTIDSCIFYLSVERAAQLLRDDNLLQKVLRHKNNIDLKYMMHEGYFYHGFIRINDEPVKLPYRWRTYSEGILLYKYFNKTFTPIRTDYSLPLFVYYYPLAFYRDEIVWRKNLSIAIDYQLRMTGRAGYSAMNGPEGYSVNSPYLISPLAVTSAMCIFPHKLPQVLRTFGVNRLTPSMTLDKSWISTDRILVDDGIALMLIGDKKNE